MDRDSAEPAVTTVPGSRAARWVDFHRRHAAPSTYAYDFVWDVTAEAIGPFCTDPDGNVFLDFTSHVGAAPLGYNNPALLDALRDLDLVDPVKIAGQDFYLGTGKTPDDAAWPAPSHLMNLLTDVCSKYDLDTVFLSNSGAEAIENAMKVCYHSRGVTEYGLTFEGAFHGRTLGALSVSRSKSVHRRGFPELAGIVAVPFSESGVDHLAEKLDSPGGHLPADGVGFLIIEPVQGEGGYQIASDDLMRKLAEVATVHDIPVIVDEVQAGLGRTGEFWAIDHYDLEPDVIVSAKGLRIGATISRSDIFPERTNRLSSTWGAGDLLASVVGAHTIQVIRDQSLPDLAQERGRMLLEALESVESRYEMVVDSRGLGLMAAIELRTKSQQEEVIQRAMQGGLLTLGCGTKSIRILPPLDVTEREIELGVGLLDDVIKSVT